MYMEEEFEDFVKQLQDQIFEETKEAYGQIVFERWQAPLYMGKIENPDGYARLTGSCGDTMEIFLKFEEGKVIDASFVTDGCGSSTACASFAAEMALGKNPDELIEITGETILKRVGGLPKEDEHCAFLAGETLQEALNCYMLKQRQKRKA